MAGGGVVGGDWLPGCEYRPLDSSRKYLKIGNLFKGIDSTNAHFLLYETTKQL